MLILITGGAYQGKSAFAKKLAVKKGGKSHEKQDRDLYGEFVIIEDVHLIVRDALRQGSDPSDDIFDRISRYPNVVLTVNELGCGIVPMEAFDRSWRETTGRICCKLAQQADEVYRVTCGIPTQIK